MFFHSSPKGGGAQHRFSSKSAQQKNSRQTLFTTKIGQSDNFRQFTIRKAQTLATCLSFANATELVGSLVLGHANITWSFLYEPYLAERNHGQYFPSMIVFHWSYQFNFGPTENVCKRMVQPSHKAWIACHMHTGVEADKISYITKTRLKSSLLTIYQAHESWKSSLCNITGW